MDTNQSKNPKHNKYGLYIHHTVNRSHFSVFANLLTLIILMENVFVNRKGEKSFKFFFIDTLVRAFSRCAVHHRAS